MKKLFYIALLINILVVPLQNLRAESFADADDKFSVISPTPNSKVGGNINIEWNSFDDDQTAIPYYVELLDGASCKTASFGRINSNSASTSSTTTNNKCAWDTHKTISTQSLNDGNYCLQICSAFKNSDAYYSICNARNITVVNVNKLPTINSSPINLTINENEPWQYQIKATDNDSDTLKYYLVFSPDFLQIDGTTGVIKTKENTSRISGDLNVAEYRVVVGVDDSVSGTTTQEFTIRVEKGRTPNPVDGSSSNSGGSTTTPQNTAAQITFNTPKENDEFKGLQNFVDWSIYDPDGVKTVTLNFSKDLENWTEIVSKTEDNFSRYSWDVTSIEDGKYYLQLKVTDKKDEVVAKTSKPFFIKNAAENTVEAKPLIINIKPENSKDLTDSPTTITGDFAPAENQEIDAESFALTINDKDLTANCVKNEAGFQCTLNDKLAVGEYQIKASIKDLNGNQGNFESAFKVIEKTTVVTATTGSNSNALIIVIALILLLVVLVGLPWFFIGYSKRKIQKTKSQVTVNLDQPINPTNYAYPQAAVTMQSQPKFEQPVVNNMQAAPDQSKNFSDFMSSYSFNNQQQQPVPTNTVTIQQPVPAKKIGEVKPQTPKTSITSTFKNLANKVTSFIPKAPVTNQVKQESLPVQVSTNPKLSQNIEMAYSGGTSASNTPQQTFVEPKVLQDPVINTVAPVAPQPQIDTNYVTPTEVDNSEEELKKMYPELYGSASVPDTTPTAVTPVDPSIPTQLPTPQQPTDDYYEPKPKD